MSEMIKSHLETREGRLQGVLRKLLLLRDGPLGNLWGGGGGGRGTKKKNSPKGKLNEKNSHTPINPRKYSCYGLKKIHTRNMITKKNSCGSKIPPPHNFSNGPSLSYFFFGVSFYCIVLRHFVVNTAIRQLHISHN